MSKVIRNTIATEKENECELLEQLGLILNMYNFSLKDVDH